MKIKTIIFSALFLILLTFTAQTTTMTAKQKTTIDKRLKTSGYLKPKRLKYNGYAYLGDVLKEKKELKKMREYCNIIGMITSESSLRNKYSKDTDEKEKVAFLKKEGERIKFLKSLDYDVCWMCPFAEFVKENDLSGFKKELQLIKKVMPEMKILDMIYIFDEPNFTDVTDKQLDMFIDAFKKVFPNVKTLFFYAIVHPKFLETKAPSKADILGIDPYMFKGRYENTPEEFEYFYQESLACALDWANRQDKPFLLAGDCFYSRNPKGKKKTSPEAAQWYYQLALTQPKCIGLVWFYYGNVPIESENLKGFNFTESSKKLQKTHHDIGKAIFKKPTPLGLQWDTFGPAGE